MARDTIGIFEVDKEGLVKALHENVKAGLQFHAVKYLDYYGDIDIREDGVFLVNTTFWAGNYTGKIPEAEVRITSDGLLHIFYYDVNEGKKIEICRNYRLKQGLKSQFNRF